MPALPPLCCPRCGYPAPTLPCPHCSGPDTRPEFRQDEVGPLRETLLALWALPRGLSILLFQRGLKRWMAPPLLLTTLAFAAGFAWLWGLVADSLAQAIPPEIDLEFFGWAWAAGLLEAVVAKGWALLAAKATSFLAFLALGTLLWWYTFSLVFEAVAGPFLDEVHGILEERWYGADPRATLERPRSLNSTQVTQRTLIAGLAGAILAYATLAVLPGLWKWLAPVAFALPFLVLSAAEAAYGRWLGWFLAVETGAARASFLATLLTATILVLALPLYLVPVVGWWLVGAIAGFATAIGLLDVPFSRRGWGLAQRLKFLRSKALPLTVYGAASGALFAIPFLGPVLMVPAASVAGLWLFARLDKREVRDWAEQKRASNG